MAVDPQGRPFVAVKAFTLGSVLAAVAGLFGVLIALSVIPLSPVMVGIPLILLAIAFFI